MAASGLKRCVVETKQCETARRSYRGSERRACASVGWMLNHMVLPRQNSYVGLDVDGLCLRSAGALKALGHGRQPCFDDWERRGTIVRA